MVKSDFEFNGTSIDCKHIICMVGLPGRGKTYIAEKLSRYLNWVGISTKVFNVGSYRRQLVPSFCSHTFFLSTNVEAMQIRQNASNVALNDAIMWLKKEGGSVAIFDATNVLRQQREWLCRQIVDENSFKCFFIESVCNNDDELVVSNIAAIKLNNPDYANVNDKEEVLRDFLLRIQHYRDIYQPLGPEDEHHSYIRLLDAERRMEINRHESKLHARIAYWLMNIDLKPRSIYLTRHGESEMNLAGRIGGDSLLSNNGIDYSKSLAVYFASLQIKDLQIWTSCLRRTLATAEFFKAPIQKWRALNEIYAGVCEELTYAEIKELHPEESAKRAKDKLRYRYPDGESYQDLIVRLEPVIMELERSENILLISHQAVLRCILSYFMDRKLEDLPYVKVPLHTLIKITPMAYGCQMEEIFFDISAVDTHIPKMQSH